MDSDLERAPTSEHCYRTFPYGLGNNHSCKRISDNFPEMLTYVLVLENCLKSICMHGCSRIHVKRSFFLKSMGQICPLDLILLRTCQQGLENNHACKCFLAIFQEYHISQHSWKIVRRPFACMAVHQSMWKCPSQCWNFIESGSESATCDNSFELNSLWFEMYSMPSSSNASSIFLLGFLLFVFPDFGMNAKSKIQGIHSIDKVVKFWTKGCLVGHKNSL